MSKLTSIERVQRFLERKSHDRIPCYEHFWSDTQRKWTLQGHIKKDIYINRQYDFDITEINPFKLVADIDFQPKILKEDEETVLTLDGNGAKLRRHKLHTATPEHVGYTVVDRNGWNGIKPLLIPDEKRINFEKYRNEKKWAKENNKFFFWSGINVFESMHPVCGHENLLIGMAMDPNWVKEMAKTYAELTINLMEILFAKEGKPDGIWFSEDLGFKERPFMSPAMYNEMLKPYHKLTIDYCHSLNLPVLMHSCGYIEPLLPYIIDAGIDCLQALEVKAGMDLVKLYKMYGEKISFMGGIDARCLISNDKDRINTELTEKLPSVTCNYGYALHSDHSIPDSVDYDTYNFFLGRGLELGIYK